MVPGRVPNPILDIYKRMGGTVKVAAELGLIDIACMLVIFIKLRANFYNHTELSHTITNRLIDL